MKRVTEETTGSFHVPRFVDETLGSRDREEGVVSSVNPCALHGCGRRPDTGTQGVLDPATKPFPCFFGPGVLGFLELVS